jgi:hypothetical protein
MDTMRLWVHQGQYMYLVHHGHYESIVDTMSLSWTRWVHHGRYGSFMDTYGFTMDTICTVWTLLVHHLDTTGSIMEYGSIIV